MMVKDESELPPPPRATLQNAFRGLFIHGGEIVRKPSGGWQCGHCGQFFPDVDDVLVAEMLASGGAVALGRLTSGKPFHVEIREGGAA